jgi:signal transduction histidine kinase
MEGVLMTNDLPGSNVRRTSIRSKLIAALVVPVLFVALITGVQAKQSQNDLDRTHREVTLALAAGGPTTFITALLDERNITALNLLGLDKAIKLARVSSMASARANTDKLQVEFAKSLDADGGEVKRLFAPTLDKATAALSKARRTTDGFHGKRALGNQVADDVYGDFTDFVELFHVANAKAVSEIDDAGLRNRAASIAEQTYTADLLSRLSRSAALTTLSGGVTQADKLQAGDLFTRYKVSRDLAISNLAADPTAQKVMRGFYDRTSTKAFEASIQSYLETGNVNPTQTIKDAADVTHPNGTDAWDAARLSLTHRGDELISGAEGSRNLYVVVFFLATGLSLLFALVIARSISEPLITISNQAEEMATVRLPDAVRGVLATPIGQDIVEPRLEPIVVSSHDEVAQVATSINTVQQRALELAVEQAVQRRNFADTFLNLGRRVQSLIVRQLDFITDLEDAEQDPDVLANLFKLDHLATRIRRNAESLVVLAGVTKRHRSGDPVPILDALRSALGEVADYPRVAIGDVAEARLPSSTAADLSHILAELIENGLMFSAPETDVQVEGHFTADGYLITVTDQGIGMTDEQIETANRRLSGNESFTVAPSRYMGHYVAGHLATGLGIKVELSPAPDGGVLATVLLDRSLLVQQLPSSPNKPSPIPPPPAPADASLGSLLSVHRRLSQREPDAGDDAPDRSPWAEGRGDEVEDQS